MKETELAFETLSPECYAVQPSSVPTIFTDACKTIDDTNENLSLNNGEYHHYSEADLKNR
jgi:hypothetical protein